MEHVEKRLQVQQPSVWKGRCAGGERDPVLDLGAAARLLVDERARRLRRGWTWGVCCRLVVGGVFMVVGWFGGCWLGC